MRATSPASRSRPGWCRLRSPRVVVVAAAVLGLVLSAPSGAWTVALAVVVLAIGYGYDLVFKGTAWSWVPFAVGIPLLPVFGWLGAAGSLPSSFAVLLPVAVVAGTGLAIANARADLERDTAAGVDSVAVRLGSERAWTVEAAAHDGRRRGRDRDAGGRRRTGRHRWPSRSAPGASSRSASRSAVGATAPGSSGPGSSRPSASGCWPRRGWPGSTGERAGTTARHLIGDQYPASSLRTIAIAFSSRSLAMVRYFARFARSVDPDGTADVRIAKDADQLVDRFDKPLLRVDQRVVGERAGRRGLGRASTPRRPSRPRRRARRRPSRGCPRCRPRIARPPAARRPSILSRSLMSVSSPRATCSASRRRFFGSSTFISS